MIITIFGATGRSGVPLMRRALEAGHTVRAAVRTPEKLGELRERVTVLPGEVLASAEVARSVDGSDAVVSLIGHGKESPPDMLARAAENLVNGMKSSGVDRIIVLTGAGVRFPEDKPRLIDRFIRFLLKTLQPQLLRDSENYVKRVRESGLRWTIV